MRNKKLVAVLMCLAITLAFAPIAQAGWYQAIVYKVTPWSDGQVRVQLLPGSGNSDWVGYVRLNIALDAPGKNAMLATLLTAASMGWEVSVECTNLPAYTPIYLLKGVSLLPE